MTTETATMEGQFATHPVVLFDGECRFCHASVNFIIDRDHADIFRFAPLQSPLGQKTMADFGLQEHGLDSVVLAENGRCWTRSTAGLRIARRLPFPWRLLYGFIIVPRPIRDFAYRIIARMRYRLFGKQETCRLPTPEVRARFLA